MLMKKITLSIFSFILLLVINGCDIESNNPLPPPPDRELEFLGEVTTPGDARGVFPVKIGGTQFAFVADGPEGLTVVNAGNPTQPYLTGTLKNIGFAQDVKVANINFISYAFVAASSGGLVIANISNPSIPTQTSVIYVTNDAVISVCVDESRKIVYAGTFNGFVYAFDISVLPSQPLPLGNYNAYDAVKSIELYQNYILIAEPSYGIEILNVQNPVNLYMVSHYDTPGDPQDIFISYIDDMAYIADGDAGLTVLDIINPQSPYYYISKYTYDDALGVGGNEDFVLTAEFTEGCEAFTIYNSPDNPQRWSYYITDGYAYSVHMYDDYVFVADGYNGLVILYVN